MLPICIAQNQSSSPVGNMEKAANEGGTAFFDGLEAPFKDAANLIGTKNATK